MIRFRVKENSATADFIMANTDVPEEVIRMAAGCMPENDYHNADHMFFATRAAIEIAIAEGRNRQQLNLLVLSMLFHDAGHAGIAMPTDEVRAFETALRMIPTGVLESCRENKFQNLENSLRDCIMATCFSMRGKVSDPLLRIVQDADIACTAISPICWMYCCSGIGLEFSRQFKRPEFEDLRIFFKGGDGGGQRGFVSFLESVSGSENVFLSEGAKRLWFGSVRANLSEIESWSDARVLSAFNLRRADLTLKEYEVAVCSVP
jgi:5'-deoxynucleotidase YfbR-like HD superfamily hydrolase